MTTRNPRRNTTKTQTADALPAAPVFSAEVSQVDVADLAGVSQSAVSRVFTPGASVSDETRAKVGDAARRLGYRGNAIARSLVTRRTNIIAIIMASLANPFYPVVLERFITKLQELGYWVLLFKITDQQAVDDALLRALQYRVDGVIMTSAVLSSQLADECSSRGTPVVLFNRYEYKTKASAVGCDHAGGGRLVAEALLRAGHRRLAFIAGQEGSSTSRDREAGFTERLGELGYSGLLRETGDYSYESGRAAARRLLSRPDRPDAIFCANDLMACGVIDAARCEFNLSVPESLAVVGFDDIPMAAWPAYDLTTIHQPIDRLVDATIETLVSALDNPGGERILRLIPGQLVIRRSALAQDAANLCP